MNYASRREIEMFHDLGMRCGDKWSFKRRTRMVLAAATLVLSLSVAGLARGQVVPAGDAGKLMISAGGTGSGNYLQYGERKMLGISGFVDIDSRRPFGVELEGRWLEWNQTANVHAETYSLGPRYHRNFGKLNPYGKVMVGFGDFSFPYGLATGRYLMVTGGGGLDYRLSSRIYLRAADVEYQYWPQFTYGAMTSVGVSSGIRVVVF
jgi:hypothetical protein